MGPAVVKRGTKRNYGDAEVSDFTCTLPERIKLYPIYHTTTWLHDGLDNKPLHANVFEQCAYNAVSFGKQRHA